MSKYFHKEFKIGIFYFSISWLRNKWDITFQITSGW